MLMYASPVVYMLDFVPAAHQGIPVRELYLLNPLASLFGLFQWTLLGGERPPAGPVILLVIFVAVSLISAHLVYHRTRIHFTKAF